MKTLVLARHAKSDWPVGVEDIKRPLKDRGKKDATFLGSLLESKSFMPDGIISSPARRARDTAQIIASNLGYEREIQIEKRVYFQGSEALKEVIRAFPNEWRTAMVFGHNPTMEDVVGSLLGMRADFIMPTSAMACIEIASDSWKHIDTDYLSLRWFLVPRLRRKR